MDLTLIAYSTITHTTLSLQLSGPQEPLQLASFFLQTAGCTHLWTGYVESAEICEYVPHEFEWKRLAFSTYGFSVSSM